MKQKIISTLFLVTFLFPHLSSAQGSLEGVYTVIIKKQEKKKRSRWSLASWLAIKETMRLQDRWLAMNSSDTVYEGFLGGSYSTAGEELNSDSVNQAKPSEADLGLYYRIFGMQAQWINSDLESGDGYNLSTHLRILGGSVQNSNITLGYGLRKRTEVFENQESDFSNPYAEAKLNLYIFDFFGVDGTYQHFFSNENNGIKLSGHRTEFGTFIDLSFVQIYLKHFNQPLKFNSAGVESEQNSEGYTGGLRFFF